MIYVKMFSVNTTRIKNESTNNMLTVNENNCVAYNGASITGNTLNIGGNADGITVFNISGVLNAACTINQQIIQSAVSVITSTSDQYVKNSTDIFSFFTPSFGANTVWMNQTVTNNITSITSNTCNAIITEEISNNTINVAGNANNIDAFNISTNSTATCTINNTVNQEAYNDLQSDVQQTVISLGMFAAMMSAMVTVAIICVIAFVIVAGLGTVSAVLVKAVPSNKGKNDYQDDYIRDEYMDEDQEEEYPEEESETSSQMES